MKKIEKFKKIFINVFFSNLRFNRILLRRFYYEFSLYALNTYSLDLLSKNNFLLNHILNFVFRFEAIQFIKINYPFFFSNINFIHSYSYLNQGLLGYSKYFFDGFLNVFYSSISRTAAFFDFSFNSLLSLDFCLRGIFNDFLYKYRFLATNFFLMEKNNILFFRNFIFRFDSSYVVSFLNFDISGNFDIYRSFSFNFSSSCKFKKVLFYFPYYIFLNKLRTVGFFHTFLDRPIAFSYCIFKEDIDILAFYNSLILSFFLWFCKISNYSELYLFINFLRKSCLLTFSRKYKRSFSWSLSTFTFDLTFFKSASTFTNFFVLDKMDLYYEDFSYLISSCTLSEVFFLYN